MSSEFNILEFAGLSKDRPWELPEPHPTDLRAVVTTKNIPSMEDVTQQIATYVGETIEAEFIQPPTGDVDWAARVRIEGLPTDIVIWVEQLNQSSKEAAEVDSGWILAMQTILHTKDSLTHFSNVMRVLGGADLHVHSVCDLATGRWFQKNVLDSVFVQSDSEPPEEVLWITRVVEAPEGGELEDRWAWVSTFGLARCGRFELEMIGIPAEFSAEAVQIVDGLAALSFETSLPPAGQTISLGTDLLVSLMPCEQAISLLVDCMPGSEDRAYPSVVIAASDAVSLYPRDAMGILRKGDTAVMKTLRSTERRALIAKDSWKLLVRAAQQIGKSEHAACLVQVPWSNSEDDESPREYLWFRIVEIDDPEVVGELAHQPELVNTLSEGHREKICVEDVTDWVLMTPIGPLGPSDAEAIDGFLSQFKN